MTVVAAYAGFIVAWLAARLIWGDRWWWLGLLNTFPAWLFLPVPVMAVLAVLDRRPLAWAALGVPIAAWCVLFGWRFVPRSAPLHVAAGPAATPMTADTQGVTVMTFNVLYTNDEIEQVAATIAAANPDLVALPELTRRMDAALAERLGRAYPYRSVGTLPGGRFGTGIYSRWPLRDLGPLKTGLLRLRSSAADVETPHGTVRIVALHPRATIPATTSYRAFAGSIAKCFRERERQMAAVCNYLDQWRTLAPELPVILAGDFNMTEFNASYAGLARRVHDAYREVGSGFGHTWPVRTTGYTPVSHLPLPEGMTRIDFIFHSEHWQATSARVMHGHAGSDHQPVVATLRLKAVS